MIIKVFNNTGKGVSVDIAVCFKRHELMPSSIGYVETRAEQIEKIEVSVS